MTLRKIYLTQSQYWENLPKKKRERIYLKVQNSICKCDIPQDTKPGESFSQIAVELHFLWSA